MYVLQVMSISVRYVVNSCLVCLLDILSAVELNIYHIQISFTLYFRTLLTMCPLLTHSPCQVLLDTPGLIPYREGRRLGMSRQFLTDPSHSVMEADISE